MKTLNSAEWETARVNNIKSEEWVNYYRNLWCNEEQPITAKIENEEDHVDELTMDEIEKAFNKLKSRKAPGSDNINASSKFNECMLVRS